MSNGLSSANIGIQPGKQRNSALELLRIISMLMIVFHHFSIYGGFEWGDNSLTIPHFWYNFIVLGGKLGVNVFVLISGYFLINDKCAFVNLRKVLKYLGQLLVYSVVIFSIFAACSKATVDYGALTKVLFPITHETWWFASTYFVLFLLHPVLNVGLRALKKSAYQAMLLILTVIWSVVPTITEYSYQSNRLLWFVFLYALSGYARLYGFNPKFKSKNYFVLSAVLIAVSYLLSCIFTVLGVDDRFFAARELYFYELKSVTMLPSAFCLFMGFSQLKPFYSKLVNVISSANFGVYLIHENPYIRSFLWHKLLAGNTYQDSLVLIPYSVFAVFTVYTACTAIDLVRQYSLEKLYMAFVDKISDRLEHNIQNLFCRLKNAVFGKEN